MASAGQVSATSRTMSSGSMSSCRGRDLPSSSRKWRGAVAAHIPDPRQVSRLTATFQRWSIGWSPGDRERDGSAYCHAALPFELGLGHRQPEIGEAFQQRGQRGLDVHPGQRGAEAVVGAVPEPELTLGITGDVVAVGVRVLSSVAVSGVLGQQDRLAGPYRAAAELDVLQG